jgi:6-phosphogluconolactonase
MLYSRMRIPVAAVLLALPLQVPAATSTGYVGTYTRFASGSSGIYTFQWDARTGVPSALREAAATADPAFLAIHPNGRFLYSVNESGNDPDSLTAFAILDPAAGTLRKLNSVSSMGRGPCHVSIDPSGRWVFVANYRSGHVAVYPVQADGSLGAAQQTLAQPASSVQSRAHETVMSPEGKFLLSADLGLDKVFVWRFDVASGTLSANDPPAASFDTGDGPRHLLFSKDGRFVYVLLELQAKLATLRWDAARGTLTQIAKFSTMPPDYRGPLSAAELALTPDGKFLYASNRGNSNSIAIMRVGRDGVPVVQGHIASGGRTPRYIGIDPSGRFLLAAHHDSNEIVTFRIDPASGALQRRIDLLTVPAPVNILFARPAAR